jgi:hypothetical protein
MAPVLGICVMVASLGVTAVDVWVLRSRVSMTVFTLGLALMGATLAAGALLLIDDVPTSSWILAPAIMAVLATLHTRALLAGAGPFRT